MRRGRDPSRTPSRPRRPVWDNPRGQLPGTGIRGDGENLYGGNLYGGYCRAALKMRSGLPCGVSKLCCGIQCTDNLHPMGLGSANSSRQHSNF